MKSFGVAIQIKRLWQNFVCYSYYLSLPDLKKMEFL